MAKLLIRTTAVLLTVLFFVCTTVLAEVKILVIPKGSKAIFGAMVEEGAQQAGNDLGIHVTWRGPYTEADRYAQIKIIEYGIRQNYDAIVLAPNHVNMTAGVQERAIANGIKVVLIDSGMDCRHHSTLVASDNYKAGQMAAHAHFWSLVLERRLRHWALSRIETPSQRSHASQSPVPNPSGT